MSVHWMVRDGQRRWVRVVPGLVKAVFLLVVVYPHYVTTWLYNENEPRSRESLQGWPAGVQRFDGNQGEPDYFKVLQLDGDYMVVGAKDFLYNISVDTFTQVMDLKWEAKRQTVDTCTMKQRTEKQCKNYIRVVMKRSPTELFVCGTNAYKPRCRSYTIRDGRYKFISEESGTGKCPYDPDHNSTALYADGYMYAATSVIITRKDPMIYREPMRTVQHDSLWLNDPDFVGSFDHEDKVYFFFRETALEYINCGKAVYSRVARLCKKDKGGSRIMTTTWTSFFKSRLNCSIPGDFPFYFDEIQGVSEMGHGHFQSGTEENTTKMVYAIFNTPSNSIRGSAVCAFRMDDIIRSFEGTFKEQETAKSNWLPVGDDNIPSPHPAQQCQDSSRIPDESLNFIKRHPLMDRAVPAYGGSPVFVHTGFSYRLTQIAVDWQYLAADGKHYDIIFTGTDDGRVIKSVNTGSDGKINPVTIEEIQVFGTSTPVLSLKVYRKDANGGPNSDAKLIVMSGDEIKSIPLHRCLKHSTSCGDCVRLQDPYCAWSTYYRKCINGTYGSSLIQSVGQGTDSRCDTAPGPVKPNRAGGPPYLGIALSSDEQNSTTTRRPTCPPCSCPTLPPTRAATPPSTHGNDIDKFPEFISPAKPTKEQPHAPDKRENPDFENTLPDTRAQQTNVQDLGFSSTTLALSICFSIVLSLAVGFLGGFFFSILHKRQHQPPHPAQPQGIGELGGTVETNKNVYVETPAKTVTEKQVNVLFNPVKPNNKLPNGGADLQVTPKKVYL